MPGLVRKGTEGEEEERDGEVSIKFRGKELAEESYQDLTILEIMSIAVDGDDKVRRKLRRMEERGKNRKEVVEILRVNWNS